MRNLGSNIQPAKSIGIVNLICSQFEKETARVTSGSDFHKELNLIVESLQESPGVLCVTPNRSNPPFKFKGSLLQKYDRQTLEEWVVQNVGWAHT